MTTRRSFIQQSTLVSLAPLLPTFIPRSLAFAAPIQDDRVLVVIQLDGGNDGLNTVIPFKHDKYAEYRKELRIPEKSVHKLNDEVGLHPAMKSAAELFHDKRLMIVQGVGYPNPNRSHFESMSIWQHAELDTTRHNSLGWIGRTADSWHPRAEVGPDSVYVGSESTPVALRGRRSEAITLLDESDLVLNGPFAPVDAVIASDDLTQFVQRSLAGSFEAAKKFSATSKSSRIGLASYPDNAIGKKLSLISRMIQLGGTTRVYYVSQLGYDTHSAQEFTHQQLLGGFSRSLKAFLDDLKDAGLEDHVSVLAFSEFGRRLQENNSAGTDHGTAGPVFIAGGSLRGGMVGQAPSLTDIEDGDFKMSVDFRTVYSTILQDWLHVPSNAIWNRTDKLPIFA